MEMRFVEPKTEEQQARAALFRSRERLVKQRTELINALRGVLYEQGHSFPTGARNLGPIQALLWGADNRLHHLVLEDSRDPFEQIAEKTERIKDRPNKASALSAQAETIRRLQTIPDVGPLTALAVETFAPPMESFKSARFCGLAGDCPTPTFVWRQAASWEDIKGGAGGHKTPSDHERDDPSDAKRPPRDSK